jgi:hypothetical protein
VGRSGAGRDGRGAGRDGSVGVPQAASTRFLRVDCIGVLDLSAEAGDFLECFVALVYQFQNAVESEPIAPPGIVDPDLLYQHLDPYYPESNVDGKEEAGSEGAKARSIVGTGLGQWCGQRWPYVSASVGRRSNYGGDDSSCVGVAGETSQRARLTFGV